MFLCILFTDKLPIPLPGDRPKKYTSSGRGLHGSGNAYMDVLLNCRWETELFATSPVPIPDSLQDTGACRKGDGACQSLQKQGNRCAGRNKEERAAACLGEREGAFLQEGRKLLRHGRGAALPLFEVLTSLRGRSWSRVLMLLCSLNFLSPFSPCEALSLLTALHNTL